MKIRLRASVLCCLLPAIMTSCNKTITRVIDHSLNSPKKGQFVEYTIRQGQHHADQNSYQQVNYDELKFVVRFDSTAIYQTAKASNQEDIDKLYGFSDNNSQHQQFSARFGWNWVQSALRLYAYTYNNGERTSQEITTLHIGNEYNCSIKVMNQNYIFSVNSTTIAMPRSSITAKGDGYKLYPYFGGDETAPHDIHVWIKEI